MSISYHVYANDGQGGPINYSVPIATVAGPPYSPPALAASSDNSFAVRAFDSITGLEEANTQAQVRILIDSNGNDITAQPNAPFALFARATAGGSCRVSWAYSDRGQLGAPQGFHVYLSPTSSPVPSVPTATISYALGVLSYSCMLAGLADGTPYTVTVRSFNAQGVESPRSAQAPIVGNSTPPSGVEGLSVVATFTDN